MLSIYGVDLNTLLLIAPSQQLLQDFTNITTTKKKELKDRYSLLNGNLFTPLGSNNFITTTKTNSSIPKLIFDSWNSKF
jgi:hypothetical protein